jgi:VanZ family protein
MAQANSTTRKRWIMVALMMAATMILGTDLFSSENTQPIIRWIKRLLFGEGPEQPSISTGEGLFRKSAHFLEYALLAILWFRALRGDDASQWRWSWFLLALLATVVWASLDELQQGFISTQRTGTPWDVLIDATGALTALLIIYVITLWRSARLNRQSTA